MWAAIAIHRARYNVLLCGWWALLAATAATSRAPHVRVTGPHHPSSGSVKRKNGGSLVVADFFPSIGTPANRRPLTKLAYSMDQLYLPQPRAPITVAGLIPNVQTSSKYRDGFFTQYNQEGLLLRRWLHTTHPPAGHVVVVPSYLFHFSSLANFTGNRFAGKSHGADPFAGWKQHLQNTSAIHKYWTLVRENFYDKYVPQTAPWIVVHWSSMGMFWIRILPF